MMRVYDYAIDGSNHCREGVATKEGSGFLFDTFWGSGNDRHCLTSAEAASATLRFDTVDFRELGGNRFEAEWNTYAPGDRQTIPSQHGLQHRYFVRNGASPDLVTQIENAEQKVAAAESGVRSAAFSLLLAQNELLALALKEKVN